MAADHVNNTWNETSSARFEQTSKRTLSKYNTAKPEYFDDRPEPGLHSMEPLNEAAAAADHTRDNFTVIVIHTMYFFTPTRDGAIFTRRTCTGRSTDIHSLHKQKRATRVAWCLQMVTIFTRNALIRKATLGSLAAGCGGLVAVRLYVHPNRVRRRHSAACSFHSKVTKRGVATVTRITAVPLEE
jgi:hypothetical protein